MKNAASLASTSRTVPDFLSDALNACRSSLINCSQPLGTADGGNLLQQQRRALAQAVAGLPREQAETGVLQPVLGLLRNLMTGGAYDGAVSSEDLVRAKELCGKTPARLIAAMLLAPAWQLPSAPALDDVPTWLWGDYAAWLFYTPAEGMQPHADFSAHWLKRLQSLAGWIQRNPGSAAVKVAFEAYSRARPCPDHFCTQNDWRKQAELHGQIFTRFHAKDRSVYEPTAVSRDGRRLRIGFIARHFGPGTDLYTTFPYLEHLDPRSFEVFLLALEESDTPEAKSVARMAKLSQVLPTDWAERLELIRSGQFDIVVFSGEPGHTNDEVSRLALHRLAALQVVNYRTGLTTGLPEIDLYVSGAQPATEAASQGFTERLGLTRGPACSFSLFRPDVELAPSLSRAQIGIPEDVTALTAVVPPAGVSRTTTTAWAKVLAGSPGSSLFIAMVPDGRANGVDDFCAQMDAALARQGVDPMRVTLLPCQGDATPTVRGLFASADLYLDATGAGTAIWLAEALQAGLPSVALRCPRNPDLDAAAEMLVTMDSAEWMASDQNHYVDLAIALARNAGQRAEVRSRLQAARVVEPVFLDTLAASDAMGALLLTAYDELVSLGREQFRLQREPLRCFGVESVIESVETGLAALARGDVDSAAFESALALRTEPANGQVRHLHGLVLHAQGNFSRAVDYLVAAVQDPSADAARWFSLAKALRANRQIPESIQALETCIRLDPKQVEALLFMLDLAEGAGATNIARDVLQCLQEVAPDDARVLAMS